MRRAAASAASAAMGWGDSQQAELEANPNYVRLMKAFRLFDKNGDGLIDAAELKDLLLRANPKADPTPQNKLTEEDCQVIISSFDENGDGKLDIEELVAAWSTIGGSDEDLDAAMKERREFKAAALKKKQEAAASLVAESGTGGEFQAKFMNSGSGLTDTTDASPAAASAAPSAAAPMERSSSIAAMASQPMPEKEAPIVPSEPEGKAETAMDRARAKAAAKVGKDVEEGAGSLAAQKAKDDPANMTAAERAKAKAKQEVAKKEARKSALKAQKAAEAAPA